MVKNPIMLRGFSTLPSGFYHKGWGLTSGGTWMLREIHKKYNKPIELTITASGESRLDARGRTVTLVLAHRHLMHLNGIFRNIKRERNAEMQTELLHFLGAVFNQFREHRDAEVGYVPGRVADVLAQRGIANRLSMDDREALEEFIPDYLESIPGTLRARKKLQVVYDALDAGRKVYLQKVIAEFRTKLNRNVQNEASWQKLLSQYILVLRHNYGEVLEKESVSLQGKFPDFMLVDAYGYLDIYEIKKPSTELLRFDASRKNHYWSTEMSKAIAQVETYIYQVQRHGDNLSNDLRDSKGIDVNIVRPRGYIIAGRRSHLTNPKMKNDFRILCDSLKNVDVILYDDLLDGLEAFVNRAAETDD